MNPFTITIKNDTGVGYGTKVYNEKGEHIEGVQSVQVREIVCDDAIYADIKFILVRLDIKAHLKTCVVLCSQCGDIINLGEPVKLLEGGINKDGLFGVLCEKCFSEPVYTIINKSPAIFPTYKQKHWS